MTKVLPQSVEEMLDIIDIEGIVRNSWPDLIYKILFGLAVFLAVLGLFLLIKKFINKRKNQKSFLPADQKAFLALDELGQSSLMQEKKWALFYFSLDEILRHYLSEAFGMDVLEKTFEELKSSSFEKRIMEFWQRAQFIKFAKLECNVDRASQDLDSIRQFVAEFKQKHE